MSISGLRGLLVSPELQRTCNIQTLIVICYYDLITVGRSQFTALIEDDFQLSVCLNDQDVVEFTVLKSK